MNGYGLWAVIHFYPFWYHKLWLRFFYAHECKKHRMELIDTSTMDISFDVTLERMRQISILGNGRVARFTGDWLVR